MNKKIVIDFFDRPLKWLASPGCRVFLVLIALGITGFGVTQDNLLIVSLGIGLAIVSFSIAPITLPTRNLIQELNEIPNDLYNVTLWIRAIFYLSKYKHFKSVDIEICTLNQSDEHPSSEINQEKRNIFRSDIPQELHPILEKIFARWNRNLLTKILCPISIILCFGSIFFVSQDPFSSVGVAFWGLGIVLIIFTACIHDDINLDYWLKSSTNYYQEHRWEVLFEILVVSIITMIAFRLRITNLDQYPPIMHGDEGEMGIMALHILDKTKDMAPPFITGWLQHPALFHYLQAASLAIFGRTEAGLRTLSALFGTACVPFIYWLGRRLWGRIAAVISAWLLTVSSISIHFSRLGLNNIESVFFMILLLLLLAGAYRDGSTSNESGIKKTYHWGPYITAGVIIGLSQFMYYGSRLLPVIAAAILGLLIWSRRANMSQVAVLVLATFLAIAPLGYQYIRYPNTFFERMSGVSVLNQSYVQNAFGPDVSWQKTPFQVVWLQAGKNLRFFLNEGDASAFYMRDINAFDPLTALLFWLGLAVAISRFRHFPDQMALLWFGLGVFLAGFMTNDSPNAPRLIVMIPSVFLLAGGFIQRGLGLLETLTGLRRWVSPVVIIAIAIFTYNSNFNTYFIRYASIAGDLRPIYVAREIQAHCGVDHIYLYAPNQIYVGHGTIRFIAGDNCATDLGKANELIPPIRDGKGIRVIALGQNIDDLKLIQTQFPNGILTNSMDPIGRIVYAEYFIPPIE